MPRQWSLSSVVLSPGTLSMSSPGDGSRPGIAPDVGVEIILDTSGSMIQKLAAERHIDIAKEALRGLVSEALVDGVPVVLRTLGGKGKKARRQTRLRIPLGAPAKDATLEFIGRLAAGKRTRTPIGAARWR